MMNNALVPRYPKNFIRMVTRHYKSKKFSESWEERRPVDEQHFSQVHATVFPFRDIWDEFSAFKGEFVFLAKLVRMASVADGWSIEMGEHFGRLAMSIAARALVLHGKCDVHTMHIELQRELNLTRAFYGADCREDDRPHCAIIALRYAITQLLALESEVLYGDDIDL